MWEVKKVEIRGRRIAYWTNGQKENPVVFFPGGPSSGTSMQPFVDYYQPQFNLLFIDYPGRGQSDIFPECQTIKQIGEVCTEAIAAITDKPVVLIAHSLGTAIAREVALTNKLKIKGLVLIQPGEYFPIFWRRVLKFVFIPPNKSATVRWLYWNLITKVFGIFEHDVVSKDQYQSLLIQWNATLDYRIDDRVCQIPTIIFNSVRDSIIDGISKWKILEVFPNHVIKSFDIPHIYDYKKNRLVIADFLKSASQYYGMDFLKEIKAS